MPELPNGRSCLSASNCHNLQQISQSVVKQVFSKQVGAQMPTTSTPYNETFTFLGINIELIKEENNILMPRYCSVSKCVSYLPS